MVMIGKYLVNLLILCSITSTVAAKTLVTDSFMIRIGHHCDEKQKICEDVSFFAIRKADSAELSLLGRTLNRKDSLEPYGYIFTDGKYSYSVFIAYAEIAIEKSGRMILFEKGEWLDNEEKLDHCITYFLPDNGLQYKDHLCFYRNQSITEVYQQVKQFSGNEYLSNNLEPITNSEYQISKNSKIAYNWLSEHDLHITFHSPTHRMKFNFFQSPRGTQVYIRHSMIEQKAFNFVY